MKPSILAARAITGITFQRVFKPALVVVTLVLAAIYVLLIILSIKVSAWWLIFLIVLVPITLVAGVIALILWKLAAIIIPRKMDKAEKKHINNFVNSLLGVWDVKSTPLPIVAFLIAKDLLRRRKSAYIDNIINNSKSLRGDFMKIVGLFEDNQG